MTIQDVIHFMQELAPEAYAEDFDNVGLLVGNKKNTVSGILITHDCLETVVDEAIDKKCNLIVTFHPIVFKGIKKFNGQDYVNRVIIKAIKNDIAIYATHTALDNVLNGVNSTICNQLGLVNQKILIPKKAILKQLTTYVPSAHAAHVRNALFNAGAGTIGNYNSCSFNTQGEGTYFAQENSNPAYGNKGQLHTEKEIKVHVVFEKQLTSSICSALYKSHPYEEVAYEIISLDNPHPYLGMGMIGELETAVSENEFLSLLKTNMNTPCIRHSTTLDKNIKKVAVLGGSGSFAIKQAISAGADAYVTSDLKYHDFYQAENKILLCDIGHYESEQYTKSLLYEYLIKKIANFAPALELNQVILSDINTNPVNYF